MSNSENRRMTRIGHFVPLLAILLLFAWIGVKSCLLGPTVTAQDADASTAPAASQASASPATSPAASVSNQTEGGTERTAAVSDPTIDGERPAADWSADSVSNDSAAATPAMLIERENRLMDQLAGLRPTDPDYQVRLQQIGAELRKIQNRLQNFRQLGALDPSDSEAFGAIRSGNEGENFASPNDSAFFGSVPNGPSALSPLDGMDAAYLNRLKEELTSQLKQLQQTLDTLGPQDAALSRSLKEEQTELLNQLKDVNERLAQTPSAASASEEIEGVTPRNGTPLISSPPLSASPSAPFPTAPSTTLSSDNSLERSPTPFSFEKGPFGGDDNGAFSAQSSFPAFPGRDSAPLSVTADRIRKANDAAVLLREAGLNQLANQALNQAASLSDPHFAEGGMDGADSTETDGTWFGSDNKSQKILDQVSELKKENDEMKKQLGEIMEELKNVETQLKLLSRQAVSSPSLVPAPNDRQN